MGGDDKAYHCTPFTVLTENIESGGTGCFGE